MTEFRSLTATEPLGASELRPASELGVERRALLLDYLAGVRSGVLSEAEVRQELVLVSRFVEGLRRRAVVERIAPLAREAYDPLFEGPGRRSTVRSRREALMLAMRWLSSHRLCLVIFVPPPRPDPGDPGP